MSDFAKIAGDARLRLRVFGTGRPGAVPGSTVSPAVTRVLSEIGTWVGVAGLMEALSSTAGAIAYRGASAWQSLTLGTAGQLLRAGSSAPTWSDALNVFGSGVDGALDFDGVNTITLWDGTTVVPSAGVYVLPQDVEATTIRIRSGVRVDTGGFIVYANGLVTFDDATAFLSRNGSAASGMTGASAVTGGSTAAQSGAGGTGRITSGVGAQPSGLTASTGNRGGGGGTAGGNAGGASGTRALAPVAYGSWRDFGFVVGRRFRFLNGANGALCTGGSGGGAGGCNIGTGTATSGGGGSGGGVLAAHFRYVTGPGIIETNGGAGGNASATGNGAAGGGGGGGGGYTVLVTSSPSPSVTVRSLGGSPGNGAGGGNAGFSGSNGNTLTISV